MQTKAEPGHRQTKCFLCVSSPKHRFWLYSLPFIELTKLATGSISHGQKLLYAGQRMHSHHPLRLHPPLVMMLWLTGGVGSFRRDAWSVGIAIQGSAACMEPAAETTDRPQAFSDCT